jgi:hypothetical protein
MTNSAMFSGSVLNSSLIIDPNGQNFILRYKPGQQQTQQTQQQNSSQQSQDVQMMSPSNQATGSTTPKTIASRSLIAKTRGSPGSGPPPLQYTVPSPKIIQQSNQQIQHIQVQSPSSSSSPLSSPSPQQHIHQQQQQQQQQPIQQSQQTQNNSTELGLASLGFQNVQVLKILLNFN